MAMIVTVLDSVLDFDYAAGRTGFEQADAIIAFGRQQGLEVEWLIETHVHADQLSAAPYIQRAPGGQLGIGERIATVQETFGRIFSDRLETSLTLRSPALQWG